MSATEKHFIQSTTDELLKKVGKSNIYPSKHIHDIMKYLGEKGFLSMIIDKEYQEIIRVGEFDIEKHR